VAEQVDSGTWRIDGHIIVCPFHYEELYLSRGKELPPFEYMKPYNCFYCLAATKHKPG